MVCQPLILVLKQGLDVKHRPGSRGGCPLINLSSPWRTVEPGQPLLIYTLRGMIGRQPADRLCSMSGRHRSTSKRAQARPGRGWGGGVHLRLSREEGTQANKAPFTVQGSDGELKEENTQPFHRLSKAADGYSLTLILTELVTGGLCSPCLFSGRVCACVCVHVVRVCVCG